MNFKTSIETTNPNHLNLILEEIEYIDIGIYNIPQPSPLRRYESVDFVTQVSNVILRKLRQYNEELTINLNINMH